MAGRDVAKWMLIAGFVLFPATSAIADAIDGDWCSPNDAKNVRISGPNVTTPTDSQTTGNYSRHAFSYIVPPGDSGAGDAVSMQLLNEEETSVTVASGQLIAEILMIDCAS